MQIGSGDVTMLKNQSRMLKLVGLAIICGGALFAQEAAPDAAEAVSDGVSLWDILYGDSIVNLLIWIGLFATSFATLWLIIDAFIKVKHEKFHPAQPR